MSNWIAEFELEDGDTMPEHMDLNYMGAHIDFHCRPMWISVSEKLPEEDGEYLLWGKITDADEECYCFFGDYDSCAEKFGLWQEIFDGTTLGCLGSEFYEYEKVVAWQPLPKPYMESRK